MRNRKADRTAQFVRNADAYGVTMDDAHKLRLIEKTLTAWACLECGDSNAGASWAIERDDDGAGKPYMVRHVYTHPGAKTYRTAVPDRERGALNRAALIMARYPALRFFHQTDPRGVAVYLVRAADLEGGRKLNEVYSRGWAVSLD